MADNHWTGRVKLPARPQKIDGARLLVIAGDGLGSTLSPVGKRPPYQDSDEQRAGQKTRGERQQCHR
jgi:hypothetical protein